MLNEETKGFIFFLILTNLFEYVKFKKQASFKLSLMMKKGGNDENR